MPFQCKTRHIKFNHKKEDKAVMMDEMVRPIARRMTRKKKGPVPLSFEFLEGLDGTVIRYRQVGGN